MTVAMVIVSTWSIVDGIVRVSSASRPALRRNAPLRRALAELSRRTHCRVSGGTRVGEPGVVHHAAFRVLERWGYATRAIIGYVTLTPLGRAAAARCHTTTVASQEVKTA